MEIDYTKVVADVSKEIAKDAYNDVAHPAAQNAGGIFGTITGFFNHVVLYPLKKLNIKYEQKAIEFQRRLEKKYEDVPEENRVEPQINIVGPTLESLKYNIMEDDLAEMFSNLLVSNMDNTTQGLCTPSFVKVIEQLTPNDAALFSALFSAYVNNIERAVCTITFNPKAKPDMTVKEGLTPEYFTNISSEKLDVNDKSKALRNLQRLGLIEIDFAHLYRDNSVYTDIYESSERKEIETALNKFLHEEIVSKIGSRGIITISSFGMDFAIVCLRKK